MRSTASFIFNGKPSCDSFRSLAIGCFLCVGIGSSACASMKTETTTANVPIADKVLQTREAPIFSSAIVQDSDTGTLHIITEAGFDCTKTMTSRSQEVVRKTDIAQNTWSGFVFGGMAVGLGAAGVALSPMMLKDGTLDPDVEEGPAFAPGVVVLCVSAVALALGGIAFGSAVSQAVDARHSPVHEIGPIVETRSNVEKTKGCYTELVTEVAFTATIPAVLPNGQVMVKLYDAVIPSSGMVEIPFRDAMQSALPEWQDKGVRIRPWVTFVTGEAGERTWTDSVGETHEIGITREFQLSDAFLKSVGLKNKVESESSES